MEIVRSIYNIEQLNNSLKLSDKNTLISIDKNDLYDYSKYASLDEFAWDEDLANKFSPILYMPRTQYTMHRLTQLLN